MGLCLSKKGLQKEKISSSPSPPPSAAPPPPPSAAPPPPPNPNSEPLPEEKVKTPIQLKEEKPAAEAKKQTHVVMSHHKVEESQKEEKGEEPKRIDIVPKEDRCSGIPASVRTSSCTKEEVDAILIQCGRLSRSSSGKGSNENSGRGGSGSGSGSRKYSGSKRSFDFDQESGEKKSNDDEEKPQIRSAHRRTRSREKDVGASELKRSGSRDEGKRSGSRRVSRSPGRRPETPTEKSRPGKMVSVPATVSTGREASNGVRKAVRSSASPRARSPANTRGSIDSAHHQHSQPTLSRNSSRKAEQSPHRRNPLNEIDDNVLRSEPLASKNLEYNKSNKSSSNKVARSKDGDEGPTEASHMQLQKANESAKINERSIKTTEIRQQGANNNNSRGIRKQLMTCRAAVEQQQEPEIVEEEERPSKSNELAGVRHGTDGLIPQTITRSRSARRSRDLDLDIPINPSSYASLLLEDIQNYHNQNPSFSLPPCVSKACSILDAVADLNSSTSSNLSPAFSEEKFLETDRPNRGGNNNISINGRFNRKLMANDPFVESEVVANDNDLMEPSLHKYVTVRDPGRDMEQQESAGSNSFLGPHWTSSWEPNSADSTDRWTSLSNTNTWEEVEQQQQPFFTETVSDLDAGGQRLRRVTGNSNNQFSATTMSGKESGNSQQYLGSGGNGKLGIKSYSMPVAAAAGH